MIPGFRSEPLDASLTHGDERQPAIPDRDSRADDYCEVFAQPGSLVVGECGRAPGGVPSPPPGRPDTDGDAR